MAFVYQVATRGGARLLTLDELTTQYEVSGIHNRPGAREALQGQPTLSGFRGPMYNGQQDGATIIRYESPDS